MTDTICLLSGGMDSTTALALALATMAHNPHQVLALSFNYGQRHRDRELAAAFRIAEHYKVEHKVIDLRSITPLLGGSALTDSSISVPDGHYEEESMRITVVPNRNAIMLSIAFGIARARQSRWVYAGMHAGDHAIYPDCRIEFMKAFQLCMDHVNVDLSLPQQYPLLITPFIKVSKTEIVRKGMDMDVPYEYTYSCYKGEALHCGTCGTCVERKEAFALAGVQDPTMYYLTPTSTGVYS